MSLDNGGKLDQLLAEYRQLLAEGKVDRISRREQFIDFALGNLNCSTNHQTTREVVEREYDRLYSSQATDLDS
jgi:hypothetical protein